MILYADWSQISSVIVNSRYFDEKRGSFKMFIEKKLWLFVTKYNSRNNILNTWVSREAHELGQYNNEDMKWVT